MSGTQPNRDPFQSGPEQGACPATTNPNEPYDRRGQQCSSSDTPLTGQHHDATFGRTAGANIADQYNTTQGRVTGEYDPSSTTNAPSNRPKQTPQGCMAISDQDDLPVGYADMGDKIIGKTQKVIGKLTNDPQLHKRGELRETGGKAAAHGTARAAHD